MLLLRSSPVVEFKHPRIKSGVLVFYDRDNDKSFRTMVKDGKFKVNKGRQAEVVDEAGFERTTK
jgi:hypothetical protein